MDQGCQNFRRQAGLTFGSAVFFLSKQTRLFFSKLLNLGRIGQAIPTTGRAHYKRGPGPKWRESMDGIEKPRASSRDR
jgi:hypothetical protein